MHPSIGLDPSAHYNSPKFRSRNQSYMRAVSTLSQASCVSQVSQVSETEINGQFESVCESVFSEVESQAMDALDLPGCFRTRSHSYLRAIQAGYSQDDECIPPMASTVTSTIRSTTDRNYVQEDSCLSNQARAYEDFTADKPPLTHDDLGCPIRRDKSYHQDNTVATAKPLSGPPVSPILFRSPRPTVPERPSPKAIQASIKESATLAAAISMQWKEEVSAMRLELAELRRDLCKELRAFNSNFNTFTKHYNTWSPQSCKIPAEMGLEATETMTGACGGLGTEEFGSSGLNQSKAGAKEKIKHVSKVSVGTQARSKVLVRQSTADAAVNCPEEKEKKKGTRKKLPKQLSMDPSILTRPQSMYVESAIPLSLEPMKPFSAKAAKTKPVELPNVCQSVKSEAELDLPAQDVGGSHDPVAKESHTSIGKELLAETSSEKLQNLVITSQQSSDNPSNNNQIELKSTELDHTERETIHLPYPVPVVTVSPPEDQECDNTSDSEFPLNLAEDKADKMQESSINAGSKEISNPTAPREPKIEANLPTASMSNSTDENRLLDLDAPTSDEDTAPSYNMETCPSIVVTEYFDTESPESPTDSDPNPDPILSPLNSGTGSVSDQIPPDSAISSSSAQNQANTEPESEDSEWPPLPEPLDRTPIYHADLVHFDLVMLTSLDQEDLDSVFMDPEPEPFDLSIESPSVLDVDRPFGQSDCSQILMTDPETLCPSDQSLATDAVNLKPSMEIESNAGPRKTVQPQVTVTVSPPSSLSPDTSLEMDFGSTNSSPEPSLYDVDPSSHDPDDVVAPSLVEASMKPCEITEGSSQSIEYSQVIVKEKTTESLDRTSYEETFLWYRWQKRTQRKESIQRSASVELWSGRYEYNSAEITYVSLTL
ncbi:uncharacterized protein dlgap2a isoform X3 [Corythoichthys intestinalis]|nr:uncharacterized protein dlgap2a isoform X3 [Corythoichthys intestinalis]